MRVGGSHNDLFDPRLESFKVFTPHVHSMRKLPVDFSVFPRIASQVIPKIGVSSLASA